MKFFLTLYKFIQQNFYIIPLYIILLTIILLYHANVSLTESISVFIAICIANVFFSYAIWEYWQGNDKDWFLYSWMATLIYFWTGLQGFIEYQTLYFMTPSLFIYLPFYFSGYYWKIIPDKVYIGLGIFYFIINISYLFLTNTLFFSSILSIIWFAIGAYLLVMKNKQVYWYSYSVIWVQLLVMIGSLINIISNTLNWWTISGLNISYLLFPLVIIIPLIKNLIKTKKSLY